MAQTTLSLLGKSLGLNGAEIGAVSASSNLLGALTMVLITARLATESARRAVIVGSLLLGLSLAMFLLVSPVALVAAALVLGVAGGLAMPSIATVIGHRAITRDVSPTGPSSVRSNGLAPARALATLGLVLSISLALGPLLESAVLTASHQHLRAAYLAFLPIALFGTVVIRRGQPVETSTGRERVPLRQSLAGLRGLFSNRRWTLAMCGQAIYSVPFAVVVVFGGLLGKNLYHVMPSEIESAIAVFFTVSLLSRAVLTWHPATAHRVRLFALCVAFTLVGLGLLAGGHGAVAFIFALSILGVPHGLTYPLALGLVAESVPSDELSRANAGFAAVSSLIAVVAPLVLGLIIDDFGARTMLVCSGIPVVLLAVVLRRLRDAGAPSSRPATIIRDVA